MSGFGCQSCTDSELVGLTGIIRYMEFNWRLYHKSYKLKGHIISDVVWGSYGELYKSNNKFSQSRLWFVLTMNGSKWWVFSSI